MTKLTQTNQHKHLGTILDDELTFDPHVDAVCVKAHLALVLSFKKKNWNFNVVPLF